MQILKPMNYNERFQRASRAKFGEVWTHRKTGKTATILQERTASGAVRIKHQSGRVTWKGCGYLASDFNPPA